MRKRGGSLSLSLVRQQPPSNRTVVWCERTALAVQVASETLRKVLPDY